jgi:hypothetical protein
VVTARIVIPQAQRATPEAADKFMERLRQSLMELPGVTSLALSGSTPFQGGLPINAFTLEQDTLPPGAPQPGAFRVQVTPGYLETLGLRLVEGRFYEEFREEIFPERFRDRRAVLLRSAPRKARGLADHHRRGEGYSAQRRGGEERQSVHLPGRPAGRAPGRRDYFPPDQPAGGRIRARAAGQGEGPRSYDLPPSTTDAP